MSRTKEIRAYRRENKLCIRCGKKLDENYSRCYECREAIKKQPARDPLNRALMRSRSLCVVCKNRPPVVGERMCESCSIQRTKPLSEKKRERKLKIKFKITPEVYEAMLKEQGGTCKICHQPETAIDKRRGKIRDLAVDHKEVEGKVLICGLLCMRCNLLIGLAKHNIDHLESAINYLKITRTY